MEWSEAAPLLYERLGVWKAQGEMCVACGYRIHGRHVPDAVTGPDGLTHLECPPILPTHDALEARIRHRRRFTDKGWYRRHRSYKFRVAFWVRQKGRCSICGAELTVREAFDKRVTNFDHHWPRARGGKSTFENLRLAHVPCNDLKANRLPPEARHEANVSGW